MREVQVLKKIWAGFESMCYLAAEQRSPIPKPHVDYEDGRGLEACELLCFVLVLLTKPETTPRTVVEQVQTGNGFEAWRMLATTLDPKSGGRGSRR